MLSTARWICPAEDFEQVCPTYEKTFSAAGEKAVVSATLLITTLGVYQAFLNGERIGRFVMAPGWTMYDKRLQVQEYDVTALVRGGDNTLAVSVGKGWYHSRMAQENIGCFDHPRAVLAELTVRYADGSEMQIVSDESWTARRSQVLFDDIYDGETVDASLAPSPAGAVRVFEFGKDHLIPQQGEEVVEQERLKPVRMLTTPKGETVLDFGQNMTGYITFTVNAKKGDHISITHAEILDKDGNFYRDNYRGAQARIDYTCRDGEQTYKPHFVFFGFRYIRIDEFPGAVDPEQFTAIAVYSDIRRTGRLSCSNAKLNRLFDNVFWGQRSNFLDVPTDCPQRDERHGWTGDAQVFARTAAYNFDVLNFFKKWTADIAAGQHEDGSIPKTVPDMRIRIFGGVSAGWADCATVCPWEMYRAYGDRQILADQYDCMKKYVAYITGATKDQYLWTGGQHYGDWLALDNPHHNCIGLSRPDFIASAYYALAVEIVIKTGRVLGEDVSEYETLHRAIRNKFLATFNTYTTQTEHIVALYFDLTDDKPAVAAALAAKIHANGDRLDTGFIGTPYLLHALSDNGYADLAYTLLLQEKFPSWLFSVNQGATTMWEHWDGIREDGSMWSADMNSYNHYAYGSVADWVYSKAAGIQPVEEFPGYEKVRIAPIPDDRIGWLEASLDTRHGTVRSKWVHEDGRVRYEVDTPVEAEIVIDGCSRRVAPGRYLF